MPPSVNTEELMTKEYKVPAGFMSTAPNDQSRSGRPEPAGHGGGRGGRAAAAGRRMRPGPGRISRTGPAPWITCTGQGVQFPPGSNAIYLPGSSRLIVHNTQSNMDLIDAIVENSSPPVPIQVTIESKFVEIQQQNQKELTMNVLLGQFNLRARSSSRLVARRAMASRRTRAIIPLPFPDDRRAAGAAAHQRPAQREFRHQRECHRCACSFPRPGAAVAPAVFGVGSVLTDPTFQVVLRALDQKKGVDLLSAPRVTTKSGQQAVIEIIREFRYPTEFDPPQIPQNFGGGGTGGVLGGTSHHRGLPGYSHHAHGVRDPKYGRDPGSGADRRLG